MQQPSRVGIVADDLTSATDGASPFVDFGHVPVILRSPGACRADVLAVDTGSRAAPDGMRAAAATAAAVAAFCDERLLLKTVDSTLRGWVREEIRAALEASGRKRLILAPAFPGAGRTTAGGLQYVQGIPVHRSAYGRDPVHPARTASVADLVADLGMGIEVVPKDASGGALRALRSDGVAILDGDTQAELNRLVALVSEPEDVLWVGSPGLAIALAARFGGGRVEPPGRAGSSRLLVVAGSANPVTHLQCDRLAADGIPVVQRWSEALKAAPVLCLRAPVARQEHAADILGRLIDDAAHALLAGSYDGVVATGGETMAGILDRVGVDRFELLGEIEPGFPVGRTPSPLGRPSIIAMKAGGFGSPASLLTAVRSLLEQAESAGV